MSPSQSGRTWSHVLVPCRRRRWWAARKRPTRRESSHWRSLQRGYTRHAGRHVCHRRNRVWRLRIPPVRLFEPGSATPIRVIPLSLARPLARLLTRPLVRPLVPPVSNRGAPSTRRRSSHTPGPRRRAARTVGSAFALVTHERLDKPDAQDPRRKASRDQQRDDL